MNARVNCWYLTLALVAMAQVSVATAATTSFTGTFMQDDEMQLVPFNLPTLSHVSIESLGYAGGVNGNGAMSPAGGFDPVVTLYDSTGLQVGFADDGRSVVDPNTAGAFDSLLSIFLAPGDYTVALTQYDNFALGTTLAEGFTREGQGNFTTEFGPGAAFNDQTGAVRNGNWAMDIATSPPNLSFTGTFAQNDEVTVLTTFQVPTLSQVVIESLGYAGGVNADGVMIPAGGFDTVVSLFDSTGILIDTADDGRGVADPVTGAPLDSLLSIMLAPGDYTVALTQYDNLPGPTLADLFTREGEGNFTTEFGPGMAFNDLTGAVRNGSWAVDVRMSAVPEPGTLALGASGTVLLAGVVWRRRSGRRRLAVGGV